MNEMLKVLTTCTDCGTPLDNVNDDNSINMRQWCKDCEEYDPEFAENASDGLKPDEGSSNDLFDSLLDQFWAIEGQKRTHGSYITPLDERS